MKSKKTLKFPVYEERDNRGNDAVRKTFLTSSKKRRTMKSVGIVWYDTNHDIAYCWCGKASHILAASKLLEHDLCRQMKEDLLELDD